MEKLLDCSQCTIANNCGAWVHGSGTHMLLVSPLGSCLTLLTAQARAASALWPSHNHFCAWP